jgi:hypothetical protein
MNQETFEAIQEDFKALYLELNRQCLSIRRGLSDTQRTGAIFADHPLATSLESISLLKQISREEQDPDIQEQASRLYYACIDQFIRLDLLIMDDMMDQFLSRAMIGLDGEQMTFADIVPRVVSQNRIELREKIRKRALPLLRKGGELKSRILTESLRILREDFGYPGYIRFCEEKKDIDLEWLALKCKEFLDSTGSIYEDHISSWVMQEMERPFFQISRYHAIYLLHLKYFDHGFSKSRLMKAVRRTLESMGIEDPLGRKLYLDIEDRKGKSRLPRCVPLRVPDEIHVSMKPYGGMSDYETLFHELGHGLHLANTNPSLPYPYRHLPRSFALTECFGFLFQDLTTEPAWLAIHTGLSKKEIKNLRYLKTLKLLCLIRRYAGKFLFEYEIFSKGNLSTSGEIYSKRLEEATGFIYEPDGALLDIEEDFYSADYLRAWVGEAYLKSYLREEFGEQWFLKREAGAFLVKIWRDGEKRSLEDVLFDLGQDTNGLLPLKQRFINELAFSI